MDKGSKVKCDYCGNVTILGKPRHRWLDKQNDIALKFHECKFCKATFPERIQTSAQLSDVRELQAMRARIQLLGTQAARAKAEDKAALDEKIEEATTAVEMFQLSVLKEQEKLRRQYGEGLGFFHRQCPKCGLDVVDMQITRHKFGELEDEETKEIHRARLMCVCGWVGRWPELKTVEG